MKLFHKIALVTGGSRGIGAAIALKLAKEGANVAITYVNGKDKADEIVRQIVTEGGKAVAIQADSADEKAVAAAVEATVAKFGRIDILVNNAGVAANGTVDEAEPKLAEYERQYAVNVKGVAAGVRAAVKHLGEGGRIITIGSVVADRNVGPGMAEYAATKAAVQAYSRSWARDLGARGITVNTVQPGPIDTDMNPDSGDLAALLRPTTALGRYGKPHEVAAAVAFLASQEASYITGATLNVDGGFGS